MTTELAPFALTQESQCRHSFTHLWDFSAGSFPERSENAEEDVVLEKRAKEDNLYVSKCGGLWRQLMGIYIL